MARERGNSIGNPGLLQSKWGLGFRGGVVIKGYYRGLRFVDCSLGFRLIHHVTSAAYVWIATSKLSQRVLAAKAGIGQVDTRSQPHNNPGYLAY